MSCRTTQAWWTVLSDPIMLNDIRSMMADVKSKNCRDTLNKPVPQQLILDLYRFLFNSPTWFPWPSHGQIPTPLGLITLVYVLINPNIVVWILLFHGFHRFCLKSVTCLVPATIMSPHLCVGFLFLVGHSRAHSFLLLPPAASPPAASHTTSSHTTCSHTTCPHTQLTSTHNLLPHTAYSHTTSLHTTSPHTTYSHTHNLLSHNFLTRNFITHNLSTQLTLTQLTHTHNLSTHNFLSHTQLPHTTYSHTQLPHTHTTYSHTTCPHTTYSHTTSSHTQLTLTQLLHTQATHTQLVHKFCAAGVCTYGTGLALVARLGPVWRRGLGDIDFHFAWQAWHLATSASTLRGRCGWHLATLTVTLHGRRGTWWHRLSLCVAGVALMALDWLWWRAWAPFGAVVAAAVCVAGVALGDIDRHFAWQAWHLATSTFVLLMFDLTCQVPLRSSFWLCNLLRSQSTCLLSWRSARTARPHCAWFQDRPLPFTSTHGVGMPVLATWLPTTYPQHLYIQHFTHSTFLHRTFTHKSVPHNSFTRNSLTHSCPRNTCSRKHTYIHTYMHTYIHTCIRTYVHTYIRTYVHTCMHAYIHPSIRMHACMLAYIHTNMHTYIHMYVRTYVPTYLHTYIHTYARIHMHTHTAHAFRWPHNAHIHTCIHIHTHFHARFYHTHTYTPLLHTIAYTPFTHLPSTYFFCARQSFTISFLFPAFPIPSSPFSGCLLEEVDMWGYPALYFSNTDVLRCGSPSGLGGKGLLAPSGADWCFVTAAPVPGRGHETSWDAWRCHKLHWVVAGKYIQTYPNDFRGVFRSHRQSFNLHTDSCS